MPSPTSPRNPLTRARFFLARAEALPGTERESFDNYLQAAIVFGRSVYHYLQSLAESGGVDAAYRAWFRKKSSEMLADPVLEYFRETRDLLVHHRHVPVTRRIFGTASVTQMPNTIYGEGWVSRGQPWYRRSFRILCQDLRARALRPVHRWRYRVGVTLGRQRLDLRMRVEAWRTRWRNRKVEPTVREFYLDDPEGLDRPAVDLVRAYLDRLEAIIDEAEARFPMVVE